MCPSKQKPSPLPPGEPGATSDLVFPDVPQLPPVVLSAAGEDGLRALVEHHHDRLRRSSIGDRFPTDPKRFDAIVRRIANFIVDTARGTPPYAPGREREWLRVRHFPMTIDEPARNVWLAELLASFDEVDFPQPARKALWAWVEALSIAIINRRTMLGQPRRYSFAEAPAALAAFIRSKK